MKITTIGVLVATVTGYGGCVMEEARIEGPTADDSVEGDAVTASTVFSGTVNNEQGRPVAGVNVVINGVARVTDSSGRYFMSLASVTTGYRLSLDKAGFAPLAEFHAAGELDLRHVV